METDTLLLTGNQVTELLDIEECITAVEHVFKLHAEGKAQPPKVMGIHSVNGGFHIKAGVLQLSRNYFVVKINSNFPVNPKQNDLPLIQGVVGVFDADNGKLLALMDSIEITIIRTGAATGVAAKYLSDKNAKVATICGCGNQGKISLQALMKVRQLEKVYVYHIEELQAKKFAEEFKDKIKIFPITKNDLTTALHESQVCITCTPSTQPFIQAKDLPPGIFIAAVGADNEEKQELFPGVLSTNKIIVDLLEQSAAIGELHHAIKNGHSKLSDVHAELGAVINGEKPGRESDDEIIIFDSTGTALQDVAAATIVYEKALSRHIGSKLKF